MDADAIAGDLITVLYTPEQIQGRVVELAREIDRDYGGKNVLLVGVLNGAVMVMADLCRAMQSHCEMDWMAVSSYGSGTKSSGVVRFLKDLSADIHDRHVLVVEDIIDTGLTLSWLLSNLASRRPASLEVAAMFRKPDAMQTDIDCKYVGFDIPGEFVVGYGLDFNGKYRNYDGLAVLDPRVYA
ncbi:hypoxanthine phosphoribosyltransferase [Raineyella sp. W15-4]|uniref:hypoxanthine phosphoribosyltransferase n=1 Tax=Raineyella sp. W15-4 TaxID=3081651 RepID=UPI0029552986|nr:hypoxanthine phosphoribosyltransferase [Raineyella sp. W15-4]WOQ16304.1 hypoxanthine phosphoribosyltransferase [Raineyella sp. W15-4]